MAGKPTHHEHCTQEARLGGIEAILEAVSETLKEFKFLLTDSARQDERLNAMQTEIRTLQKENRDTVKTLYSTKWVTPIAQAVIVALLVAYLSAKTGGKP